jgi:hypothetical protein
MARKLGAESSGQISGITPFVNRTVQLWNQLPEDDLGDLLQTNQFLKKG